MTVEPEHAYTVLRRPLLPPKPEQRALRPILSMAEEARQVRARFRHTWGPTNCAQSGVEGNNRRKVAALARRDELAAQTLELLAERAMASSEIREACRASENVMSKALSHLRAQGLITFTRKRSATVWRIQEAGE